MYIVFSVAAADYPGARAGPMIRPPLTRTIATPSQTALHKDFIVVPPKEMMELPNAQIPPKGPEPTLTPTICHSSGFTSPSRSETASRKAESDLFGAASSKSQTTLPLWTR